jgi:MFS family permease
MYGAAAIATDLMLRRSGEDPRPALLPHADTPQQPHAPDAQAGAAPVAASRLDIARGIAAACLIILVSNFAMHLVNLRMHDLGIAGSTISWTVALQALAICVSALAARPLLAHLGLRALLPASAIVCAGALVATFFATGVLVFAVLRAFYAVGLTLLVIGSEYLVTARAARENSGRLIACYTTAVATSALGGPLLVGMLGVNHSSAFLVGAAIVLLSAALLGSAMSFHEGRTARRQSSFSMFAFMPIPFFTALIFGVADNGGLSMLSVYGALNGYDHANAVRLVVFAALGAMLFQFPMSWLATRLGARRLLATIGLCSIALLALLPAAIGTIYFALAIVLCLGGLFEGLYTVALFQISRERRLESLSSLNACFISIGAFGEIVGPVASGISMQSFGPHGIVGALAVAFAIYVFGILNPFLTAKGYRKSFP